MLPKLTVSRCQAVRLPLFANRNGTAIQFIWSINQRPAGSGHAGIANPSGVVTGSRHWEYAYPWGLVPTFVGDVPGTYLLQLQATLPLPDPVVPGISHAVANLEITVQAAPP